MTSERINEIYELLLRRFGPQKWWPGDSPFEIILGAILTQNTNWANVEKALLNLRAANCLTPEILKEMPPEKLAELIRPAGYYKVKTKRIKNFLHWLFENYNGDLTALEGISTASLRDQLLEINGIGPETADSILLYGLGRETFVIDTYTARVAIRHQLTFPEADYHELKYLFESNLPAEVAIFNEYHALIVRVGKEFCKPTPKCETCPLNHLPHITEPEF